MYNKTAQEILIEEQEGLIVSRRIKTKDEYIMDFMMDAIREDEAVKKLCEPEKKSNVEALGKLAKKSNLDALTKLKI